MNKTILLGRLAETPELRQTTTGDPVVSFDLAVPNGKEYPPDYIPIVCYRDTAVFVSRYLTKGRQIAIEGKIKTRKYTDKNGNNRKAVEVNAYQIYFADSKSESIGAGNVANAQSTAPVDFTEIGDDNDLPF